MRGVGEGREGLVTDEIQRLTEPSSASHATPCLSNKHTTARTQRGHQTNACSDKAMCFVRFYTCLMPTPSPATHTHCLPRGRWMETGMLNKNHRQPPVPPVKLGKWGWHRGCGRQCHQPKCQSPAPACLSSTVTSPSPCPTITISIPVPVPTHQPTTTTIHAHIICLAEEFPAHPVVG